MSELNAEVRVGDLGQEHGMDGAVLAGHVTRPLHGGAEVDLTFASGAKQLVRHVNNLTTYEAEAPTFEG